MLTLEPLDKFLAKPFPDNALIGGNVLDKEGIMEVMGASELGKSYLVLQMCLDVAAGVPVLGQWKGPGPMKCVLIQAEVSPRRFQDRCRKLAANYPAIAQANLTVSTYRMGSLFDKRGAPDLERALGKDFDLICLDPIRPFHNWDENDSRQMGNLFQCLARLNDVTGAAVIFVHHERKPMGLAGVGGKAESRGSTVITDRPDTVLRLAKTKLAVELTSEKLRNGLPGEKAKYQYVCRIDEATGLFVVRRKAQMDREMVQEAVEAVGDLVADVQAHLTEECGVSERTVRRAMKQGEEEGWMKREGGKSDRRIVLKEE